MDGQYQHGWDSGSQAPALGPTTSQPAQSYARLILTPQGQLDVPEASGADKSQRTGRIIRLSGTASFRSGGVPGARQEQGFRHRSSN